MNSNENIYSLYDYISVGICIIDKEYNILFWNEFMEDYTDFKKEELLNKKLYELFPAFNKELYRERIDSIFNGWPPVLFSSRLHKPFFFIKNNLTLNRFQEISISPFQLKNTDGIFAIMAISDVTELSRNLEEKIQLYKKAKEDIKKRKELEQTLKESEARYHALFDNIYNGVAIFEVKDNGKDYIYKDLNKKAEIMDAIKKEEVIGKSIFEIRPAIKEYGLIDVFERVRATGIPEHFPAALYKDDRLNKWYDNYIYKLITGEIVAVYDDVTERKRAEIDIFKSKNQLKRITDNMPAYIALVDNNLKYIFLNKRYEELYQTQINQLIGKKISEVANEHAYHRALPYINKALNGETVSFENSIKDKNGKEIFIQIICTPYYEEKIFQTGIIILSHDITERKQILNQLQESEEKFRLLAENIIDVIWVLNLKTGKFTYISPSIYQLRGYTPEEAMNQGMDESLTIESKQEVMNNLPERINNFMRTGNDLPNYSEIRQPCKDGSIIWVETVTRLRHGKDGSIEVLGVSRNIENRKKVEIEIQNYISKLKELNATKDKFFSIIAHDLRNPFNGILGFSKLLLEDIENSSTEEIKDMAELIYSSSESGYKLLENLLEWSRTQTGTIEFNPETLHLKGIVIETIAIAKTQALKKNIQISYKLIDPCYVVGDANMITTIIRNLLSNAIKFTPKNGRIEIKGIEINDKYEVSIIDTGVGIKKEDLEKLFRIDIHHTTKGTEKESGSGLGLILCKEFVEKHGGRIWVESDLGSGSKFKFTLMKQF